MIKQITTTLAFMASSLAFSQVGIQTQTPHASADLELGSVNKTLYLNRVANPETDIVNPQEGMILYDTTMKCLRAYQGEPAGWSDCLAGGESGGSGTVLTCASATFSPAFATVGVAYSGILTIPYTGGNGGAYPGNSFTVNNLTFTLAAGSFVGDGNLVYNITGTPAATGSTSVNITAGGLSCTALSLSVNAVVPTNSLGAGSFSGRTCFDVVEVNNGGDCGLLTGRASQKADFSQAATQTYTFTPTGTVSNVRFVFVNTNGQVIQSLTGGNSGNSISAPVTATVTYYNNLNTAAAGLSRNQALTADIYVIYNNSANNTGSDLQLKLTAKVQDCSCCGAKISPTVWKEFLCHNLGADTSLDPHVPVVGLIGAHVQWGRRGPIGATGNSQIDWQTAGNTSYFAAPPTASDANADNISGWNNLAAPNYSWRTAAGVKTANDPCPTGYRVPTMAEWTGVNENNTVTRFATTWTNGDTNYGSALHFGPDGSTKQLTLPAAGARHFTGSGSVFYRGEAGMYWSSTEGTISTTARYFQFNYSVQEYGMFDRTNGYSIRCIAQ